MHNHNRPGDFDNIAWIKHFLFASTWQDGILQTENVGKEELVGLVWAQVATLDEHDEDLRHSGKVDFVHCKIT